MLHLLRITLRLGPRRTSYARYGWPYSQSEEQRLCWRPTETHTS